MKFETIEQRNFYFDTLIDSYQNNDIETCKTMILQLSNKEERELLYFIYRNIESPGLFSFVLDVIY